MAQQNYPAPRSGELPVSGLDLEALQQLFQACFDTAASPRFFFAPGWVDLMGCPSLNIGGWSLSLPVDRGVVVAAAPRTDRQIRVQCLTDGDCYVLDLDQPVLPQGYWLERLARTVQSLKARNVILTGADLLISSNLPPGLDLQSLTALEEALMLTLYALSGAEVYGAQTLAMAGQAWLKDHDTQALSPVPLRWSGVSLVLSDSRVQPGLMGALSAQRARECGYGLDLLRMVQPALQSLNGLTVDVLEAEHCCIEDGIIRKRLRHCVSENLRVRPVAEALEAGDFPQFGRLLAESMVSWRDNFELSCLEWDTLAALPQGLPGVVGARVLVGGDFEGCTLHWVLSSSVEPFETAVHEAYESVFGQAPYISVVQPGAIAQELLLPSLVRA